jgi:acyl dehydratase
MSYSWPVSVEQVVSGAAIGRYCEAIGESSPEFTSLSAARAAGYGDIVAPPMFAAVYAMPAIDRLQRDPQTGLDFARAVHGAQEFVWERPAPVIAGEQICTCARLENVESRNDLLFYTMLSRSLDERGEIVSTGIWTAIVRDREQADATRTRRSRHPKLVGAEGSAPQAAPVATERVLPEVDVAARYALASGDHNPIHLDDEAARRAGLPRTILHGMWTMAQAARIIPRQAGLEPLALRGIGGEFRAYAFPEEELVLRVLHSADGPPRSLAFDVIQGPRTLLNRGSAELATGPPSPGPTVQ